MAQNKTEPKNLYPQLVIKNNEHPNRLLAFPFIGIFIRTILLVPAFIEAIFLIIALFFFWLVLPFTILFTGKYWDSAYNFFLGYMKFQTKITLYYAGLTDKYPGFSLSDDGIFILNIEKPKAPSRFLAFPFLGYFIRVILLIPYLIFSSVLGSGETIAVFFSWFIVLFTGKYPESFYEYVQDVRRIALAQSMYIFYLSDTYPSFYMAMKNKTVKALLIIAGVLLFILRLTQSINNAQNRNSTRYNYYHSNQYIYPKK